MGERQRFLLALHDQQESDQRANREIRIRDGSLTIGETFFAASLILVPVMMLLVLRGVRGLQWKLFAIGAAAAVIGYLGVSRWESYPFIPARLLWLLPLVAMASARGLRGLP